ncbi:sensor histidine kinase [Bernardetia sp. OM2101]|uniref:sensor histidine kinase n=1 Tax=Bernardetia sp. OM2101 TaxID=3344876 RepID=UPI0035D09A01
MNQIITLLKKYKAVLIGFPLTFILVKLLQYSKLILIDEKEFFMNTFFLLLYGVVISLMIYTYFKKGGNYLYLLLGLLLLIGVLAFVRLSMQGMTDNPVIILIMILFWMGGFYAAFPSFFTKYKIIIWGVYGVSSLYFLYVRLFSGGLEMYLQKKETALSFFILPIPAFFLIWIYEQWKWLQNLKAQKTTAELALLKTQINPHFFFNTLNNLYSLTVQNSEKAPTMILQLSDMMRYTIYEGQKQTVLVLDEIEYLKNYIELQKIRYQKDVEISFSVGQTINTETTQIAPLLFIILLENAFKHGVETLRENAFLTIQLDLIQNKNQQELMFWIENNFDSEENNQKQTEQGIGLQNLKRRLELLYPHKYSLEIEQKETIYSAKLRIEID